jgi:hypothetical protein
MSAIIVVGRSQTVDSKDGEMSEWLKEHAWKAKRARDTDPLRRGSTHTRSAT